MSGSSVKYGKTNLKLCTDVAMGKGEVFSTFNNNHIFINKITGPFRDKYVQTPEFKITVVRIEKGWLSDFIINIHFDLWINLVIIADDDLCTVELPHFKIILSYSKSGREVDIECRPANIALNRLAEHISQIGNISLSSLKRQAVESYRQKGASKLLD